MANTRSKPEFTFNLDGDRPSVEVTKVFTVSHTNDSPSREVEVTFVYSAPTVEALVAKLAKATVPGEVVRFQRALRAAKSQEQLDQYLEENDHTIKVSAENAGNSPFATGRMPAVGTPEWKDWLRAQPKEVREQILADIMSVEE